MSSSTKLLVGIAAFLIFGWLAIHSQLSDHWPGSGSANFVQQQLQQDAKTALIDADLSGLTLTMSGQKAVLFGQVPSNEMLEKARSVILSSSGSGGLILGGVSAVDLGAVQVTPPIVNPKWSAVVGEDGVLVLRGYLANAAEQEMVLAAANQFYPGNVVDNMKIASGVFVGASNHMVGSLRLLKQLNSASITLEKQQFMLVGSANDQPLADQISAEMLAISGGYSGSANISFPAPIANEFGVVVVAGEITDSARCQALFDKALSKNKILFASSRANIGADSYGFLDFLAELAEQCEGFALKVSGHTDNTGPDGFNLHLSDGRAKSVVAHLIAQGIDADRLVATGYGSSRPVCRQNTSSCRAQNRRIEIEIEQ